MKLFHINTGRGYAQPYESDYAVLRRCLIANPGIPLTAIESCLRELDSDSGFVLERIKNLEGPRNQLDGVINIPFSYKRQCPECAKLLYHTDIYALPWLNKCPIHHCKLTDTCPGCHRHWPNKHELTKRKCQTCGLLSLKTIHTKVITGIRSIEHTSIKKIHDFIEQKTIYSDLKLGCAELSGTNRFPFTLDDYWWKEINSYNTLFPAFHKHLVNGFGDYQLAKLEMENSTVCKKSSKLYKRSDNSIDVSYKEKSVYLKWFIESLHEVIYWISQHMTTSHVVLLTEYYHVGLEDIIKNRRICPYCTAFSLWFYNYVIDFIDYENTPIKFTYDILASSGFSEFYRAGMPYLISDNCIYTMNKQFNKWFYQRGLIVSFLHVFKHIIMLTEKINNYKSKPNKYLYIDYRVKNVISDCQFSAFNIVHDKFVFYYKHPDPLMSYKPPKLTGLTQSCKSYHKRYSDVFESYPDFFRYEVKYPCSVSYLSRLVDDFLKNIQNTSDC